MTNTVHPIHATAIARAGRPRISGYGRINIDDVNANAGIEVYVTTPQALGEEARIKITIPGHVLFDLAGRALNNQTWASSVGGNVLVERLGGIVEKAKRR
tara:strand:- start:348 stop:647 length:300 start_codon:yes stop_codon:yes gene_type:complete